MPDPRRTCTCAPCLASPFQWIRYPALCVFCIVSASGGQRLPLVGELTAADSRAMQAMGFGERTTLVSVVVAFWERSRISFGRMQSLRRYPEATLGNGPDHAVADQSCRVTDRTAMRSHPEQRTMGPWSAARDDRFRGLGCCGRGRSQLDVATHAPTGDAGDHSVGLDCQMKRDEAHPRP